MTRSTSPKTRLIIPTFQTLELIDAHDIISIKAFENYSRIYLTDNRIYTSTLSFGKFVDMLQTFNFFQCHKSYIVNLDQIVRYFKNGEIEMTEGLKVPVARRRKEAFLENLSFALKIPKSA